MDKTSRQIRRHHRARLRRNRAHYLAWGAHKTPRALGYLVTTPKACSCFVCRNRRHDEGPTIQERRMALAPLDA